MAKHVECKPCTFCNKKAVVTMTDVEYRRYISGLSIQEALPSWPRNQRELLLTGTHAECWDAMFPKCTRCDELVEGEEDGTKDPVTGRWTHHYCPGEEPL
jgi:hypothetical protein